MSTNYPNSVDSYTVHQDGAVEDITAADVNNLQDAVVAIENQIGTSSSPKLASTGANTFTGIQTAPAFAVSGLAGATTSTRIVGGTNGSAPTTGTWNVGDEVTDITGTKWICTVAGTPGTWAKINAGNADSATTATNATKLNNQLASYYATASSVPSNPMSAVSGGKKVQSGTTGTGVSTSTLSVTFPQAFTSTPIVVATIDKNYAFNISSLSTTGFTANISTATSGWDVYWIAVGN